MPQDHADKVASQPQQAVANQYRSTQVKIVAVKVRRWIFQDVLHTQSESAVNKEYVNKGQQKLSRSGDQCAKSRTGNSHLRCSEFSKNEHIVRTQVDKERND